MPLFNQVTTLNSQGRFAPGVSYYAGVKAPRRNDFTLPKAESSFNIDLSRIGDALIRTEELKYDAEQKQLAREDRKRELEFEDKRIRDLADLERQYKYDALGVTREGNYLDYYADMARLQFDKEKTTAEKRGKDLSVYNALDAKLKQINNEVLQKGLSVEVAQAKANQAFDDARAGEGYLNFDYERGYKIMDYRGFGSKALTESRQEALKNILSQNEKQYQEEYAKSPYLQAMSQVDSRAAYNNLDNQLKSFMKYQSIANNPNSTKEEKAAAHLNMEQTGVNIARYGIYNRLYNLATSGKLPDNPVEFQRAVKEMTVNQLKNITDDGDALFTADVAMRRFGIAAMAEDVARHMKEEKEVTENNVAYMVANEKLGLMKIDSFRVFMASPASMQQYMLNDPSDLKVLSGMLANVIAKAGMPVIGKDYIEYRGENYSTEELDAIRKMTSIQDPATAVATASNALYSGSINQVRQGYMPVKDMLKYGDAGLNGTFSVSSVNTPEDADTTANNFKMYNTNAKNAYAACYTKGTDTEKQQCVFQNQISDLCSNKGFTSRLQGLFRNSDTAGFHTYAVEYDGNNVNLFLVDDGKGFQFTSHDYDATKEANRYIRSLPYSKEIKMFAIKNLLKNRVVIRQKDTKEDEPNLGQKVMTGALKLDQAIEKITD